MEYGTNNWYKEQILQENEGSSFRFHVSSFVLHVLTFSAAIFVGSIMPKPETPVLMEFSVLDSAPAKLGNKSEDLIATSPSPKSAQAPQAEQDVVSIPEPVKMKQLPSKKVVTKEVPQPVQKQMSQPTSQINEPQIAIHKISNSRSKQADLVAPVLETEEVEDAIKEDLHFKAQKFDDRTLHDDLNKIDEEQETKVAALQTELDSETNGFLAEQEKDLNDLEQEKNKTDQVLKSNAAKMKNSDSAKIAAAQSAEKAAAEAYANQQAAEARAAAVAAARAAEERAAQAKGTRHEEGTGSGTQLDGSSFGVNGPVRRLEDLRQMPGNKRPAYDNEDRFKGRQGEIAFLAFVSMQGKITDIKLIKATGHRSLDSKTLAAIREWKFYPGQEGWVEIPFRWDLKGGPQEMTTTLRRKISQRE